MNGETTGLLLDIFCHQPLTRARNWFHLIKFLNKGAPLKPLRYSGYCESYCLFSIN